MSHMSKKLLRDTMDFLSTCLKEGKPDRHPAGALGKRL